MAPCSLPRHHLRELGYRGPEFILQVRIALSRQVHNRSVLEYLGRPHNCTSRAIGVEAPLQGGREGVAQASSVRLRTILRHPGAGGNPTLSNLLPHTMAHCVIAPVKDSCSCTAAQFSAPVTARVHACPS